MIHKIPYISKGIYFLVKNNRIVYVGKSINAFSRLGSHMKDQKKKFDSIYFYECENIDELEHNLIAKLKPKLNIVGTDSYIIPNVKIPSEVENFCMDKAAGNKYKNEIWESKFNDMWKMLDHYYDLIKGLQGRIKRLGG